MNYKKYCYLELVLFDEVNPTFHKKGFLKAKEFFLIVLWKANRAKSNVAKRLLRHKKGYKDLDSAVKDLTRGIADQANSKDRLRYLMKEWNPPIACVNSQPEKDLSGGCLNLKSYILMLS